MGSSSSKAARAAGSSARKYPSTNLPSGPPPPAAANHQPCPTVHPEPSATSSRSEAINLDASDPDFARSLRSLGAVQPNPTLSPSSKFSDVLSSKAGARNPTAGPTQPRAGSAQSAYANTDVRGVQGGPPVGPDPARNPALMILKARERIAAEAEREAGEMGRRGYEGRRFMDLGTIRQALSLRERGVGEEKVESMLELRRGTLGVLGRKGVVGVVEMSGD
ncbi:hypothetical protein KVT40_006693 [Elsinoe batatas]|uniref:Helix-turn-helix domain-containing protein n=1 Tax=Elsinoe batatas TaxID=2601811 RepID=A0A8K0KWQ6_9PEZI|nr:hypothetical protein KVT40_006693 [Elsinoe batatas]